MTTPQQPPPYGQPFAPPPGPATGPAQIVPPEPHGAGAVPPGPMPTYQQPVGQPAPAEETPEAPATQATPYGFDDKGHVQRTKISGVWIGLIAAAVVLILLIIFIAQNLNTVGLHFLGFYGQVSLGLAMLVAAICGVLIAAVIGTVRILQLRKSLRRNVDTH